MDLLVREYKNFDEFKVVRPDAMLGEYIHYLGLNLLAYEMHISFEEAQKMIFDEIRNKINMKPPVPETANAPTIEKKSGCGGCGGGKVL